MEGDLFGVVLYGLSGRKLFYSFVSLWGTRDSWEGEVVFYDLSGRKLFIALFLCGGLGIVGKVKVKGE